MSVWTALMRKLNPYYAGAGSGRRMSGLRVGDAGPNRMLLAEGTTLRERARWFWRSEELVKGAESKLNAHVVGGGVRLRSLHPDPRTAERIEEIWERWVEESDATGRQDFYGQQRTMFRSWFVDGEALARLRSEGRASDRLLPLEVHLIEADQLPYDETYDRLLRAGEPARRVVGGVEMNGVGRPVAYHLLPEHPRDGSGLTGGLGSGRTRRVRASEILHLMEVLRPGQVRGETMAAAALERIWQLRLYDRSEIDRKGLVSRIMAWVQDLSASDVADEPLLGKATATTDSDGRAEIDLTQGEVPHLPPGKELKVRDSSDLTGAYETFMRQQLHLIAAGLRTPYDVLTGDLSQVNFSSIRAGRIDFNKGCRVMRKALAFTVCRPVLRRVIEQAFQAGLLQDSGYPANRAEYERAAWSSDRIEWVDPVKEIMQYKLQLELGLMSLDQAIAELGRDPKEVNAAVERDRARGVTFGPPRPAGGRPPQPTPGPARAEGRIQ